MCDSRSVLSRYRRVCFCVGGISKDAVMVGGEFEMSFSHAHAKNLVQIVYVVVFLQCITHFTPKFFSNDFQITRLNTHSNTGTTLQFKQVRLDGSFQTPQKQILFPFKPRVQ